MTTLIPKFDLKNGGSTPTGAINRPINEKLSEFISAGDFGMSPSNTATQNSNALLAAINSVSLGIGIYIPAGTYQMAGDILTWTKYGVVLTGESEQYTYYPISNGGTVLQFTSGSVAFSLVSQSSDFSAFQNLTIDGTSTVANGLDIGGCKYVSNCTIQNFTGIGIQLDTLTNSSIIQDCGILNNNVGIKSASSASPSSITPWTVKNCNIRRNYIGLTIEAGTLLLIDKCIIESNTYLGMYINCQANSSLGEIIIRSTWFEGNATGSPTSGSSVIIEGDDVYNVDFVQCLFDTPSHSDVVINRGSYISFYKCRFSLNQATNVTVGANASYTQFVMCNRGISGPTAQNISDSGLGTYIQDYPWHFLGRNKVEGTSWTNVSYTGFTQTNGKITAANSSGGSASCTLALGQTYKGARYAITFDISGGASIGQLPVLTVSNGNNSATLNTYQTIENFIVTIYYTETITGTGGLLTFSNTAACQWYMTNSMIVNETTVGYVNSSVW